MEAMVMVAGIALLSAIVLFLDNRTRKKDRQSAGKS
jgi:hypothetical protein